MASGRAGLDRSRRSPRTHAATSRQPSFPRHKTLTSEIEPSTFAMSTPHPVYLDYNGTTPVDPEVLEAMLPFLGRHFGNPSSQSLDGEIARNAVNEARRKVAALIGAAEGKVLFTSGGTESNNHAILGAARQGMHRGRHIVTTAIEHPAVLEVCRRLEENDDFEVTRLPVDEHGRISPDAVGRAIRSDTVLVSVMHANNEVGTLQPIAEIGAIARQRGVFFHCDPLSPSAKCRSMSGRCMSIFSALQATSFTRRKGRALSTFVTE